MTRSPRLAYASARTRAVAAGHSLARWLPEPLRFRHIPRSVVLWACYAALNLGLALYFVRLGPQNGDWQLWLTIPGGLASGSLYADEAMPFVWSPVAAWVMLGVIQLGYWAWFALHFAALAALRDAWLMGAALLSWPFWHDAAEGNTLTFVFVAGAVALSGNRWAAIAYLGLFLLMPRPVQVPLALWLLWREPETRLPFAALFAVHGALVGATGLAPDWFQAATGYGIGGNSLVNTIGPTKWFGLAWLIVGLPLGLWLARRGAVGLAGLSIAPYWIPSHLMMALLDTRLLCARATGEGRASLPYPDESPPRPDP